MALFGFSSVHIDVFDAHLPTGAEASSFSPLPVPSPACNWRLREKQKNKKNIHVFHHGGSELLGMHRINFSIRHLCIHNFFARPSTFLLMFLYDRLFFSKYLKNVLFWCIPYNYMCCFFFNKTLNGKSNAALCFFVPHAFGNSSGRKEVHFRDPFD
jgi:hypothetical protein